MRGRGRAWVVLGGLLLALPSSAAASPRAQITGGPSGSVSETSASFPFAATGPVLLGGFTCRLDAGAWSPCTSPAVFTGVTPGAHSFEVQLHGVGADPVPALAQWTVLAPLAPVTPAVVPAATAPKRPRPAAGGRRDCRDADALPGMVSAERMARALHCLLAADRRRRHLPRLRADARLRAAALRHARDMVGHRFFGHRSSTGAGLPTRIRPTGYLRGARRWTLREALHWGEGKRGTPRRALVELLASPSHRPILLARDTRDLGIGVVMYVRAGSGRPAATYVLDFGRRS